MSATVAEPVFPARIISAWRRHLEALAAVWAAVLLLFWSDAAGMAAIWWNASTYNHCLLIPPLIVWLVWQRRTELQRLVPAHWLAGLFVVGAGAVLWLLGHAAGLALARHLALVLMLQGCVVTLLGKAVSRGLAFPLFYAFFLVPLGDELVPALQTLTADIAMALLNVSGVPAHLEGVFITTPAGYFEVAEACAGAKFLIAMVALGALVANVCFRSWPRRALFVAACLVVPLLANGVRAWGTIYVAEGSGVDFAASFDHVVYGGIFFAAVIALLLAAAWPFFDRPRDGPWFDPDRLQQAAPMPRRHSPWQAAAFGCAVAAAPLLWAGMIAASGRQAAPAEIARPDVPGWMAVAPSGRAWTPHFAGADLQRQWTYRNAAGQEVILALAVFARQEEGREVIGFGQGAVGPESDWAWTADAPAPPNGRAERIVSHGELREVVSFYRVGDILTGSAMGVKLETLKVRLLGGSQRAVALLVSAPAPATGESPRPVIDAFLAALGPVEGLADRAADPS